MEKGVRGEMGGEGRWKGMEGRGEVLGWERGERGRKEGGGGNGDGGEEECARGVQMVSVQMGVRGWG